MFVFLCLFFFFFFSSRRRHTRWNCDWSSDVCSSDLGTKAADLIVMEFHNGGNTSPALISITVKKGSTVEDSAADIHAAFDRVTKDVPHTRMVDQVNAGGDKAFVTKDHRTAYAYVFYPFPKSQSDLAPTKQLQKSLDKHKPAGATAGVTGIDA